MALRNWLEETFADVNPWDNGKTGASVRAARAQKKVAPARTPAPGQRLGVRSASTQQSLGVAQPQSRISRIEVPKIGATSAKPLTTKIADPSSLQVAKPIGTQPQLPQSKPNIGIPLAPKAAPLPDQDFTDIRVDRSQRKKLFGIEGGRMTTVKADQIRRTNKDKYVANFDRLNPEVQKILVNSATENAKKGDKAAQNTLRALTETGRMKGSVMDFVEGSNERFLGGLDRAALRTADFVLPGKDNGGMGTYADQIDATKTKTRQFSGAGRAGEVAGETQKIATDVASMVIPAVGTERAIRSTQLISGMAKGNSKLAKFGAYAASNAGGGLPATAIQYGQQIGAGEDPNLAEAVGLGVAADLIVPAALKGASKAIKAGVDLHNGMTPAQRQAGSIRVPGGGKDTGKEYILPKTNPTDVSKLDETQLKYFSDQGYTSIRDNLGNVRQLTASPIAKADNVLDSVNPTGGLHVAYDPAARMSAKLGDNMTTLDKTAGGNPDEMITVYRGAPANQKEIAPGDFITTNKDLARSYTGDGNVIEMNVRKGDIIDDANEPLGDEYIYRPATNEAPTAKKDEFVEALRDVQKASDELEDTYDDIDPALEKRLDDAAMKEGFSVGYDDMWGGYVMGLADTKLPITEAADRVVKMAKRFDMDVQKNTDGTIRLFHGTSPEAADAILKGNFEEGKVFFSPSLDVEYNGVNGAGYYGDVILQADIDPRRIELNPAGEFSIEAYNDIASQIKNVQVFSSPKSKLALAARKATAKMDAEASAAPAPREEVPFDPEAGRVDNFVKNYAESIDDPEDIVKEVTEEWYQHGKQTKGGQMIDTTGAKDAYGSGMKRISEHNKFYSDFYAANKKAPTKGHYDEEVRRQLEAGGGSMVDPDQAMAYQMVKQRKADDDAVWAAREENPSAFDDFLADNGLTSGTRPQAPTGDAPEKLTRFANKTVQESDEVSTPLKKMVKDEKSSYMPVTNEGRAAEAIKTLDGMEPAKAYGKVINDLENGIESGGQKEFNAIELAKRLDAAGDDESLAMSTEILHKLSDNATKRGQEIQALSYLTNRTPEGLEYGAVRDLKKAIGKDKVTPEMRKEIKALKDEVAKHEPGTDAHNFAVYNMAKYVTDQIPVGMAAKVVNLWRAGLLSAPTTTGGNIIGNTGEMLVRKLAVDPIATFADAIMSVKTGKRTMATNGGFAEGAKAGSKKLKRFMKTGYDERNALSKYDSKEINYGDGAIGTKVGKYVNGVYRLMSVADQPFWYGARNESLAGLAKVEALNRKLKGAEADDFMNEFLDNPPKEALEQATKDAKYGTFQNPTLLGSIAAGIKTAAERHGGDKARAAADFFIPFTQVPASIATRVIQRTPVGTSVEIVRQIIETRKGKPFDQRRMAKAIGEGTFGTAVFVAGYNLANSGMMTFGFPEDPKERELWEAEGKQPYSLKVGDRWYSLNYLQPFGTLLAVGGEAGKSVMEGANPTEVISRGVGTAGQAVMNQSFLKGISGVLDAIDDPKRYAENYVENTASSVVPNFIRSFARASDDKQRDVKGTIEGIQSAIPGMRQGLPEKQDMFGQSLDPKDNFLNQYVNPLRPSKVKNDDVVAEMRRLQDAGEGVIPSVAKKNTFEGVTLDRKQISEINKRAGKAMQFEYGLLMTSPEYQGMTDKQKADSLRNVNDTVYGAIKTQYAKENNIAIKSDLDKKQKRYLAGESVNFASRKKADGSSADSTDYAKDLDQEYRKVLGDYDIMTSDEREKWFNEQPDAEYKYELAKANNDKLNGTLSKAEEAKLKSSLAKAEVGSTFTKETRELYALSKKDLWSIVSTDGNGKALAEQVVALGDALEAAGLGDNKFRLSNGSISIAPVAKGSGGRKGGGSKKSSGFKMDGYMDGISTSKSLRSILAEAKIESSAKKPQKA